MLDSATITVVPEGSFAPVAPERSVAPEGPSVWLSRLMVQNFRNYAALNLTLDARPVVLTGANGAGKTNLMEALSLFAPGRGLRRVHISQLQRQQWHTQSLRISEGIGEYRTAESQRGWSVSARIETPKGGFQLGTGIASDSTGENPRRQCRIDGRPASQAEVAEHLAVSWLTPDMDQVLAAPPAVRRRFLDRLVIAFDPAHNGRLLRYDKASRERGRLLDEGCADDTWLEALEAEMAASGVAIIAARKALAHALDKEAAKPVPAFPSARLQVLGEAEDWIEAMPAVDVEDRLKFAAQQSRKMGEKSIAKTMAGASASLLVVRHSATGQTADHSSTGEQKALVLSVILAHARLQARRLGRPPIVLLDDVAAHLDEYRRAALFDLAQDLRGQVWFSGTDARIFAPILKHSQHIAISASSTANGSATAEFIPN